MNVRGFWIVTLVLCILGGLIAGIVTPAVAQTLPSAVPPATARVHLPPSRSPVATASAQPQQPTPTAGAQMVLGRDTFQRPDQPLWGHASDGYPWGGDANTNQAFSIKNGAGQITGANGTLQALLNINSADAEILLSGSLSRFDANGGINLGGALRWQNAGTWYKVLIDGQHLQLLGKVNGARVLLKSIPFQAQANVNYSLRFRVLGSNLLAKAWPSTQSEPAAWMLVAVDTHLTAGIGGIRVLLTLGVTIRITSFLETSVPAMV